MSRILETKLVAIDSIRPYPKNSRKGDVEVIRESLRKNGMYRPVVVWQTKDWILAGNHTWRAVKAEGHKEIWATFIECADEDEAKRINAVDNRAPELGSYDTEKLVELLGSLPDLEGTGWKGEDLDRMVAELGETPDLDEVPDEDEVPDDDYRSQLGVIVLCMNQKQQQSIYEMLLRMAAEDDRFNGASLKVVAV